LVKKSRFVLTVARADKNTARQADDGPQVAFIHQLALGLDEGVLVLAEQEAVIEDDGAATTGREFAENVLHEEHLRAAAASMASALAWASRTAFSCSPIFVSRASTFLSLGLAAFRAFSFSLSETTSAFNRAAASVCGFMSSRACLRRAAKSTVHE
jgi:hypothetical protein